MKLICNCLALLAALSLPSFALNQERPKPAAAPIPVVTIGASLAAGTSSFIAQVNDDSEHFDDIYQYQEVLAALEQNWQVETFAEMMFFSKPILRGQEFLTQALAKPRRIVLAVDYLFWFGYGNHYDDSGQEGATRMAFLKKEGFSRLEQLWADLPEGTAPPFVLIGTLPDVRDATVLSAAQKPNDEELAALNAAIIAWADEHSNVLVVPLAERLDALKAGGQVQVGTQTFTQADVPQLMLSDRLHPSTKGSTMIAVLCVQALHTATKGASPLLQSDPSKLDPRAVAQKLIAAKKATRKKSEAGELVPAGSGK